MLMYYLGPSFDSKPPRIEAANQRFNRYFVVTSVGMILYGLLLPRDWESLFGPVAFPIVWAAHLVPATIKVTALSPIPELVKGFYGLSSWVSVLFAIMLASKDPLGARIRFGFSRPDKSFLRTFCFIYFFALPILIVGLWVIFFLPISIDMTGGPTWGMKLFVRMISDRMAMALFGGIATATIGGLIWLGITVIFGPIFLIFNKE